ncbi:MAG TPA: PhzF family phenazine biosynthesis isomerase [Steroidobacteraceae bacterium]|nr:PhzF family phenazine biosynthesis isomerase [Steroidobacteraceae bacterium]
MRIFQVDAFTRTRFAGNPASVVLDADGQSELTLSALAREFAHAEIAFVLAATGPDHDVRVRFFNARKEMPFVGHATIAAHAVLLALGRRGAGVMRQSSAGAVVEVRAGDAPAHTERGGTHFEFRQTVPELDNPLPLKTTLRVAEALKLPATRLHETLPARIARKGSTRLLVPVADVRSLEALAPNADTLMSIGQELGADGFFVFGVSRGATRGEQLTTESRMFCPALGIAEDPASGNAHAMLASYLFEHGVLGKQAAGFVGLQGRHMNRPSEIAVRLETEEGELRAAHVGGGAFIVSEGTLSP